MPRHTDAWGPSRGRRIGRPTRSTLPRIASRIALAAVAIAVASGPALAQTDTSSDLRAEEVHLLMRTDMGDLHLAVDTVQAPITAGNFLRYVDTGLFTGGTFYRTVRPDNQPDADVKIEVVQGGMDRARSEQAFDPIPLEGTDATGIRHLDGTLSMARSGPNTARAEFFITIGDQPSLDTGGERNPDGLGFAAFGRVLEGMEIVREIQALPADGQYLVTRVGIRFVERVTGG